MEGYKFWIHLTLSLTSVRSIGMRLTSISDDNNTQANFCNGLPQVSHIVIQELPGDPQDPFCTCQT